MHPPKVSLYPLLFGAIAISNIPSKKHGQERQCLLIIFICSGHVKQFTLILPRLFVISIDEDVPWLVFHSPFARLVIENGYEWIRDFGFSVFMNIARLGDELDARPNSRRGFVACLICAHDQSSE